MNRVIGGADQTLFDHQKANSPKHSRFNISRITNLTAEPGMIIPFDWIDMKPGDVITIDTAQAIDTLPLVQTSLTRYKVVQHWYYQPLRKTWRGAKTATTKGRTGNVKKTRPLVDLSKPVGAVNGNFQYERKFKKGTITLSGYYYPRASHSLASFLGVPADIQGDYDFPNSEDYYPYITKAYLPYTFSPSGDTPVDTNYRNRINNGFNLYKNPCALQFVMYQQICKFNYLPSNLLQNCTALFPEEGDDEWLLPYNASITNYIGLDNNDNLRKDVNYSYDGIFHADSENSDVDNVVDIRQLRYATFDPDYFTSGLPWLQRGEVTTSDIDVSGFEFAINSIDAVLDDTSGTTSSPVLAHYDINGVKDGLSAGDNTPSLKAALNKLKVLSTGSGKVGLTANNIRQLLAMSVWQERNAMVDGSYNRMIYQHWMVDPQAEELRPIYIGGTADYIDFSTVIQNGASTSDSPLGSTAGFGSSRGSSNITTFKSLDYGYVMGIMIIKPDTTYMQGVEHGLSCVTDFEDETWPEFEQLSPEPILNKEIFVSGDPSIDDDLFCYQERYMYLKVRQNVNRGLFQSAPSKDILFSSFTQGRWFNQLPKLSYQFLVMSPDNLRRDWLAYPAYPTFRCQILTKAFITRGLSYTSEPNTFGF